ncbi:MAG: tRNA lysidine(34) synthetase TilS [Actinomycetaceae bacterium]|nr:tRNA lysidine(34) synthetase TilS [Actinomycetaceae bacterium]
MTDCTQLIGPHPRAATRTVSLAVRAAMQSAQCDQWLIAYSGGADSLALLVTAADIAIRRGERLTALIVDHGLRKESAQQARQALDIATEVGVEARIVTVEVPADGSIEASARAARYQALLTCAQQLRRQDLNDGRVGVLLGHTMDDQAETVLLGLARGSGARSLAGMRPATTSYQVCWLRPLLKVRADDTREACRELQLEPVEDPTNAVDGPWRTAANEPLPRIALRHHVIPALSRALGQDVVPALARTASLLEADADALDALTPPVDDLDVDTLLTYQPAIRARVIKQAAVKAGARGVSATHIGAIEALITKYRGQGAVHLPGNVSAWREKTDRPPRRNIIRIQKQSPGMEHWEDSTTHDSGEANESV